MSARQIKVNTDCVANHYAGPNERIVEFSSPNGGGLISFFLCDDGRLNVQLYRLDETVSVGTPGKEF